SAGPCRGERLDGGVALERRAGLGRRRQAEVGHRHDLDAERRQHGADLFGLAAVVRGDDQLRRGEAARHQLFPIASRCSRVSSVTPFLASSMSSMNCGSLNGSFSAVPCTSTMPPLPVSTKLASASALESSSYSRSRTHWPLWMPHEIAATASVSG